MERSRSHGDRSHRVRAEDTARCQTLLAPSASLPRVGPYLGHALLRYVAAALEAPVRGGERTAADMSLRVGLLYSVASFRHLRGHMIAAGLPSARTWSWNVLAAMYCEGTKILCEQRVLQNPADYTADPLSLHVALSAPQCRAYLRRLQAAPVVDEWVSEEAASVSRELHAECNARSLAVVKRCRQALARA